MKPDVSASLDFLRRWRPEGPWNLVAINPDRRSIEGRTFDRLDDVGPWIERQNETRNVYFTVNSLLRPVQKKPEREDVATMDWLHVDVDPRIGEEFGAEQTRILALFGEKLPKTVPPPTVVLFSGGGYQGFWRLREPIRIDGQPELYEDAKRYNLQLELLFGGDNCHNVDRIMRVPGTVNWPNERKRKKGQTPALARLVSWLDEGGVHELSAFTKAALVQTAGDVLPGQRRNVNISGNVARLASVDELPENVPAKCRVVIVQGVDPDDLNRHDGRSQWLFWVCCELVRCGVPDETIYAIITDPEFLISASVLDKGSQAERYALRQIDRAHDFAVEPWLERINGKHAVIGSHGGKCRIISEEFDADLGRTRLHFQSFADFKNRYGNKRITLASAGGKPLEVPVGVWWCNHEQRREYDTIVFSPGREVAGAYNLWRGFAFDAKPGVCDKYLAHIRDNICRGRLDLYEYLLSWMALAVQQPANPGHTSIVLRGNQGTGKGVFISSFGALFGRHFIQISDPKHLTGSFNSHLRDCIVLFGDEAFWAGDKKHEGILKRLVTEEQLTIEAKGVDVETSPNYVHLLMASNEHWVVPAGFDERRFVVLDVSDAQIQNVAYFSAIRDEMRRGGYEALLHLLMTRDLAGFNVRAIPKTDALQEQKMFSLTSEEEWWYSKLVNGEILDGRGWPACVFGAELERDYRDNMRLVGSPAARGSSVRLGLFMRRVFPDGWELRAQLGGEHEVLGLDGTLRTIKRPRVYRIPPVSTCRAHWDRFFGGPYKWPSPLTLLDEEASAEGLPPF